jgi:FkbM family methyltransferase
VVQQPLVSVIVPFLNAGTFLDEAIGSVFAQSYTHWELLLVDDGSDDGSSEVARRWAAQHPGRVRALEHEGHVNRGQSASRNLAIKQARGELLAFLDADDLWLPHKLEHQVGILARHPEVGMTCGPSRYWHSWADDAGAVDRVVLVGAAQDAVSDPPKLLAELYPLGQGNAPCPSSMVVRRDVCERIGGFEESFRGPFSLYEDQIFLAKLYLSTPVYISSLCCDYYRQHSSSVSSEVFRASKYHDVRFKYLQWLEDFFKANGYDKGDAWDALQRALYRYRRPVGWFLSEMRSEPRKQLRAVGGYMMRRSMPEGAVRWLRHRLARRDPPEVSTPGDRSGAAAEQGHTAPPPAVVRNCGQARAASVLEARATTPRAVRFKNRLRSILPEPALLIYRHVRTSYWDQYEMNRGRKAYSAEGEDLLLTRIFQDRRFGVYVDIGAFQPIYASNTYLFYKRGWRGINIDPTPGTAALFHRKRPHDLTLEVAVGAREEELDFYIFGDKDRNTLDTRMKQMYDRSGESPEVVIKVKVRPLSDILTEHLPPSTPIDFFNIDTEGHEEPVIHSNDWSKFRPKILCIEFLWLSLEEIQRHAITRFLKDCDYELFAKCHYSVFYRERGFELP